MLENILNEENDAFVLFYDADDPDTHLILEELERIDEKLDKQDLTLVKISDDGAIDSYGLEALPALVYFENGVPEVYLVGLLFNISLNNVKSEKLKFIFKGDMTNDDLILKWMLDELKQEEIKEITVKMLDRLVEKGTTHAINKTFEFSFKCVIIVECT